MFSVKVAVDKSYHQNGLLTTNAVESSFVITSFKTFGGLIVVKSEFQVVDFRLIRLEWKIRNK